MGKLKLHNLVRLPYTPLSPSLILQIYVLYLHLNTRLCSSLSLSLSCKDTVAICASCSIYIDLPAGTHETKYETFSPERINVSFPEDSKRHNSHATEHLLFHSSLKFTPLNICTFSLCAHRTAMKTWCQR